jgi:4-amino-4-deoxy-L-arabinose transferase-like glycosyltransferase
VLSAVFLLPGPDLISANVVNVLISAAGAAFVYFLGVRLWAWNVGVAGGILYAFFPSNVLFSTLVLTEAMFAAFVAGLTLLFVWWYQSRRKIWGAVFALGFVCGVAALLRGEGIFLLPAFAVIAWLLLRSRGDTLRFAAIGALGLGLVIGVWTMRNAIELGSPVPVSTSGGVVAAIGHWDGADGGPNRQRTAQVNRYYEGESYPDREVKAARKQLRDAADYAVTHPLRELQLIPLRFWFLFRDDHGAVDWVRANEVTWSDSEARRLKALLDVYYFTVVLMALAGTVLWIRTHREGAIVLLGVAATISVVFSVLFFGDSRFHASLVPILCLLAAPAIVKLARWLGRAAPTPHQARP